MASQSRILNFFASAKGRRFTFYASITASLGAFAVKFFPETFLVKQHREFVALYKEGLERPITDAIQSRYEIALEFIKPIDYERQFMEPFMVTGFDCYHIGSTKYRYGALTGVPINYTYNSKEDINKSDIIIRGKPVDWTSQGGLLLEQSLVLTEDEKVFGITREIFQMQNNKILPKSLYASGAVLGFYTTTTLLNSKLRLFYKPLSLRVALYGIVGSFAFGIYSFLTDFTQVSIDGQTDEKLATFGQPFIEAGIRFYDKLLKKNIAIRDLTGDNSEFTALGNENYLLRHKRLPLTMRKAFFEAKLAELKKKEENPATDSEKSGE